jgi:hypothetical protein
MNGKMVTEGQIVCMYGHEFIASDIKVHDDEFRGQPRKLLRFTGTCTDRYTNRDIRGTGFDGARYGWYVD